MGLLGTGPAFEFRSTLSSFFEEPHEYKDLQLLLALPERFWDTTCTFHFPGIGEVMLTPYDFSVITGLRLGGERIKVNDFLTLKEIKSLLGVVPSNLKSKNVSQMWLYENIESCKTVAMGTCIFKLLFIGTFLCPDMGSTVSLHYLWSLRDIDQIKNYDWGGMAYVPLAFMTQLFRRSLSSLEGTLFVWQVQHVYPLMTIPVPPCPSIRLADLLSNEVTTRARIGHIVSSTPGIYFDFIQTQLQALSSEEVEEGEENPPPSHVSDSSSSFMESYPYFLAWQYEVINADGLYSSVTLDRPEHTPSVPWLDPVDDDLMEESMQMIGGLQLVARTQSSRYVINEASWV
ncbi:hypothetical protein SO802_015166 [Lithocarpus litseifolius]|uniref:Aminotransferase-like plant mobile domain-containing protein n=1 Tax=Lithocarpus litseifolius TaxID=425828 RepID=A0AAW2CW69_9ROSI